MEIEKESSSSIGETAPIEEENVQESRENVEESVMGDLEKETSNDQSMNSVVDQENVEKENENQQHDENESESKSKSNEDDMDPNTDKQIDEKNVVEPEKDNQNEDSTEKSEQIQSQENVEDDVEANDNISEKSSKKKKEKKSKKDKKDKKDKKEKKRKSKSEKEIIIKNLAHDIFGSSDEEGGDDAGEPKDDAEKNPDEDYDDVDFEQESKEKLKKLAGKKREQKKSKRSRDKDDTPKKRSKKNKISDENQDELGTGEEEEAKPKEPNFFDDFISSLKAGKGKRKKDDIGIDQIETINDFKIKMDLAFEEDRAANQKGQPALSKLKMLGEVTEALDKKQLHTTYIENDLLPIIKKWLDPLPDRSLPNMKIRENLLRALMKFPPIDADELKDSGLGRVVMFLSKHPNETPQNKKVARMLIERWARPIFGIQEHFRADRDHEDEMEEESTQRKEERKRDSQSNSQLVDMENELNRR